MPGGSTVGKPINPTKTATETKNFSFDNWYTSNDNGITLSNTPFDFNTPITNNITLYAKWTETIFAYTITFNSQGGSSISNQIVAEGNSITRPASPTKTSTVTETYTFDDWYTSTDGGQTLSSSPFNFNTPVTNDLTLYAKWTTNTITYTVTYETIRGTVPKTITVNATTILSNNELPVLTYDGYYFDGWYDGNNKAIAGSYAVTKNITLHAKWDFEEPFTIECINSGSIKITNLWTTLKYSKNDGVLTDATKTISVVAGDKICFYASVSENQLDKYMTINCTKDCYIYGNFMSLVSFNSETGEWNANATSVSEYAFTNLLNNNTYIKNHNQKSLFLPATTLADHCYENMFSQCTKLTKVPVLPATTLAKSCYFGMFKKCTNLKNAPALPSTTLTESCYEEMFSSCTNLINAPELSATTLASSCYASMFAGCTSLKTAPSLPATTLASNCYASMFNYCTNLINAPTLPATTLSTSCYSHMFDRCKSLTSAPSLPATNLASSCYASMFVNCTSLKTAPSLPATNLEYGCYNDMFDMCTSLTSAPALPATKLATACYQNMFLHCTSLTSAPVLLSKKLTERCYSGMFCDCTNLKYIKCLAEDISASECTNQMLDKVSSSGTFIKSKSMKQWTEGGSGIPTGWTVLNATE